MKRPAPFRPLTSGRVTVRPFLEAEFAPVWAAFQARRSGPRALGARAEARLRHRITGSGHFTGGSIDLAIEVDGRLIGDVQARQPRNAMPPGVFELGIEIYDPADHGKGYGSVAVRLLTGWLFARMEAERVQAGTAMENAGMRRVLERLGYTFEGVMRGFMGPPSARQDFALYGVTRPEWESRYPAG